MQDVIHHFCCNISIVSLDLDHVEVTDVGGFRPDDDASFVVHLLPAIMIRTELAQPVEIAVIREFDFPHCLH